MLKELQDVGLSEKEARVYLASLELGRATAEQLAKHARIVRPTAYFQIKALMEKGLMSTFEEGKKSYFVAESPELLNRLLVRQKDAIAIRERDLANMLPELIKQFASAGERPIVRFFTGKEGITAMREEVLELEKGEEINIIFSRDVLAHFYTAKELDDFSDKRMARGIHSRYIYTSSKGKSESELPANTERRYLQPERLPIKSDIFIYQNNLALMALQGPVFGIVIESKELAESFRALFSLMWEIAEA